MLWYSPIIRFDEATSALENGTQAKVQAAIDNMRHGGTVVIIAHRLSTIAGADRILFMRNGRIPTSLRYTAPIVPPSINSTGKMLGFREADAGSSISPIRRFAAVRPISSLLWRMVVSRGVMACVSGMPS